MELKMVIPMVFLIMVATLPTATGQSEVPFTISNRGAIGDAAQITSEADGTTIWNFVIHPGDNVQGTDKSLTFELLMEADTPVYAMFEIMDSDGVTTALYAALVLPGRVVESLDDLTPIMSEPLDVGDIKSHEFLSISIFLFKDPDHEILYDNGHIVTLMRIDSGGGYNCYQREAQCFSSYAGNFASDAVINYPWGWEKDLPEKAGWSYNGIQYVMSQNVATHFKDLPAQPEQPPDVTITANLDEAAFGETFNVIFKGQFAAATALLYHVDVNGTVSLVAVDQANPLDRSIDIPIPDSPTADFPAGEYWLYVNVLDNAGNEFPHKFEYEVS